MPGFIRKLLSRGPRILRFGLVVAALALTQAVSPGGTAIKLSGITGDSIQPGHAGWIDASDLEQGAFRVVVLNASGGGTNKATYADLFFTKPVDKSSPALNSALCLGSKINDAQIEFIKHSPPFLQFYKLSLTNVYLNRVTVGISSNGPSENISLFFEKISWTYTQISVTGQPAQTVFWDRASNTGTNLSFLTDKDFDGMPDSYETDNGLNPNLNDADVDSDGDGLTNYQEFLAGTLPNNSNSVFRVTKANLANGMVRVTWTSEAGRTYTIRAASTLNGPYTAVRNVPSAGAGETSTDFPPSAGLQFFRVSTP